GKAKGRGEYLVPGSLVIKVEGTTIGANFAQPLSMALRLLWQGGPCFWCRSSGLVGGLEWIAPECVFYVSHQKLLVLLFVVDSQFRQLQYRFRRRAGLQELIHMLVHVTAVLLHLFQARAREGIAQPFIRLLAYGVVVRVEEVPILGIQGPVTGEMR